MKRGFLKRKKTKQILAGILALVLVATNVSVSPVLAEESSSEGAAGTEVVANKIDVWDFGAEVLDTNIYNNLLDADTINSWYGADVAAGSTGASLPAGVFTAGDLVVSSGEKTNNRLRTTNTAITRYDEKSKSLDGVTYSGFFYSNNSSNPDMYVGVTAKAGDILTFVVSSNGTDSCINFVNLENPDVILDSEIYESSNAAEIMTFYAPEDGNYKIYSSTEKLVVCRVYREHTNAVTVSGAVTAPEDLTDYSIAFTNQKSKAVTTATVTNGNYSVTLNDNYTYDVSLVNANGYIITGSMVLDLAKGSEAVDFPVDIMSVTRVKVSGAIAGLTEEELAKATISFTSEATYVPELTFSGLTYEAEVETGVTYDILVEGINDYSLTSPENVAALEDTTIDLVFEKKPVYDITLDIQGAEASDLAESTFTFTNLNEEGYVYTFTGTEGIQLRDGVYSVVAENTGAYVQKLTSNLTVNGAAITKTIAFDSDITEWVFTDASFNSGKYANAGEYTYNGLHFTNGKSHGGTYLYSGAGTISVPVKGNCTVTVNACYQYSFYFESETEGSVNQKTGSTGQIDGFSCNYVGEAGMVDITVLGTSYINSISVTEKVDYQDTVTVGASDCDYTTINAALDAVRAMDRTESDRVTILIQPGNYEEMLVIDTPNVTLKNASATPSIATTNSGVDIDENAVRITSYYGHGYTYYSMGNDCKYNEEILAVNKENGYASFENPGSGTTSGSYWNATVVVNADGVEAEGIIFENSFNQYVSEKAANDVIVAQSSAKEDKNAPRATLAVGSTAVQDKAYVERAAALAITNDCEKISFDNCKFIGRQDTLYGGTDTTAAFYDCAIYGGTDYIFGAMTAVFAKCDLVFNTSENGNDVGYITAAQTKSGRGMLMYNCTVTSTVPGEDTASEYPSKAGYLGRPWQAGTGEAVFYNTIIEATDSHWYENSPSLIMPAGWLSTLSGESVMSAEYGTYEMAKDVDNQAERATWASTLTEPVLADGTTISVEAFLGDWDAFAGKDMEIVMPTDKVDNKPQEEASKTTEFVLDTTTDLTAFNKGEKANGDSEKAGTEDYFTLIYSASSKVDGSTKTFEDGYAGTQRVNFGGTASTEKNAIKFTTEDAATVKVWWVEGGEDNRQITILDSTGAAIATTAETLAKNATCISSFEVAEAGTYYLGSSVGNNYIFRVVVTEQGGTVDKPARAAWENVVAPEITAIAVNSGDDKANIDVTVAMEIGYDGADKIAVNMLDEAGNVLDTRNSLKEGSEVTVSFTPDASGVYSFNVTAMRDGETATKASEIVAAEKFVLPLQAPYVKSATCLGEGAISIAWNAVVEAEVYILTVEGTEISVETTALNATVEGLTVGESYTFAVQAVRGDEVSEKGTITATVVNEAQREWAFTTYGSSTSTATENNGYSGSVNEGNLSVWSLNGKGKLVPASTDGIAYYYTVLDPETENFTLEADIEVEKWKLSNGQEGFGMMVSDTIGENGDTSSIWNNSYMASVTKVEYFYDTVTNGVSDAGDKYSMKIGIGSQEKKGITAEALATLDATGLAGIFSSGMTTLETSAAEAGNGAGTYNIIGNAEAAVEGTIDDITTFHFTIQRNNTGYKVSYTDMETGETVSKQYYHDNGTDELTKIDPEHIYAGFFASRNAKINVTNVSLTTIAPEDDAAAEGRPVTYVTPSYTIDSATIANSAKYELVYYGNADGTLTVKDADGKTIVEDVAVKAYSKYRTDTTIEKGANTFTVTFTPDADYCPSEYELLTSYESVTFTHTVNYDVNSRSKVYVSPEGTATGDGSKANPVDIYTAVAQAVPGQQILVMEGTYHLSKTVITERGMDGTADNMIYLMADPENENRPVFDFDKNCAGMIFAGDYWYFQGFDVTESASSQKGIQVSGSNNVLDDITTYRNGNTGIQVSRYKSSDSNEDWPANNLILNCTSYLNADPGYEDADGFAAKLTVGEGNVFDGCIAAYNADDGWDLFAKVETGPIGKVVIKNSIAFKNGYDIDENGNEINAGNGNGFKMGGSSISGYHTIENSIAFANKAKGIDSNSCPDIQVYNCTSFNNESYNVAFYTNDASNTDFFAEGILSYKTSAGIAEQFKLKGTQDEAKVYKESNYYFDGNVSANSLGENAELSWFVNTDSDAAVTGITRNADGTINMNNFFALTAEAPENTGARMAGTPSAEITLNEDGYLEDTEAGSGEDNSGSEEGSTEGGNESEDNNDAGENAESGNSESGNAGSSNSGSSSSGNSNAGSDSAGNASQNSSQASGENNTTNVISQIVTAIQNILKYTEKAVVDAIENATAGSKVEIDMNGRTTISNEVLEAAKEKLVDLVLEMDGYSWTIAADSISGDVTSIDLEVKTGTDNVPADVVSTIENATEIRQISLTHDGAFGFVATLTLPLESEHEGMYGNLFYYNEETKALEFMNAGLIDEEGNVSLTFNHASEYVIAIGEDMAAAYEVAAEDEAVEDENAEKQEETTDVAVNNQDAFDMGTDVATEIVADKSLDIMLIALIVILVLAAACGIGFLAVKKRK